MPDRSAQFLGADRAWRTIEAKIVQDADRMEALGALGIMRAFYVSGRIGREPFDAHDLYVKRRPFG